MTRRVPRVETDPLREIDDRLDRWARWRRQAVRPPTGGYKSSLGAMAGEGSAIVRGDEKTRYGLESAARVRESLKLRLREAKMRLKDARKDGREDDCRYYTELVDRFQRTLSALPSTTGQLPFASMIHGTGYVRDRDFPEEEDTEAFFNSLPKRLRRVMHRNWVNTRNLTQEENAFEMNVGYSTFKGWVKAIKLQLARWERGRQRS